MLELRDTRTYTQAGWPHSHLCSCWCSLCFAQWPLQKRPDVAMHLQCSCSHFFCSAMCQPLYVKHDWVWGSDRIGSRWLWKCRYFGDTTQSYDGAVVPATGRSSSNLCLAQPGQTIDWSTLTTVNTIVSQKSHFVVVCSVLMIFDQSFEVRPSGSSASLLVYHTSPPSTGNCCHSWRQ